MRSARYGDLGLLQVPYARYTRRPAEAFLEEERTAPGQPDFVPATKRSGWS